MWSLTYVYLPLSSMHRRRKWGRGQLAPKFQVGGGHRPTNFTHCLHNELHCSIVDGIACRHCSSRKSHFCCLKKMSPPPPQVRTSSYAYAMFQVRKSSHIYTKFWFITVVSITCWYNLLAHVNTSATDILWNKVSYYTLFTECKPIPP